MGERKVAPESSARQEQSSTPVSRTRKLGSRIHDLRCAGAEILTLREGQIFRYVLISAPAVLNFGAARKSAPVPPEDEESSSRFQQHDAEELRREMPLFADASGGSL